MHCYPVSFNGVIGGGERERPSGRTPQITCPGTQTNGTDVQGGQRSQKFPNCLAGTTTATCCAACVSDPTCIAWVWSDGTNPDPAGETKQHAIACIKEKSQPLSQLFVDFHKSGTGSDLVGLTFFDAGMNCWPLMAYDYTNPAQGRLFGGPPPAPKQQAW